MNAKTKTMLIGGVLGAAFGIVGGMLYYNSAVIPADDKGIEHVETPSAGDALKLGLSLLGILRSLSTVG
ncbi:MAG: hypothetical protein ACLFU8_07410 [Anaerolineales bacterium]